MASPPRAPWLWPATLALPLLAAACSVGAVLAGGRPALVWTSLGAGVFALLAAVAVAMLRQSQRELQRTLAQRESAMQRREKEFQQHLQQRNSQWTNHLAARSAALEEAIGQLVQVRIPAVMGRQPVPAPFQSKALDEKAAAALEDVLDTVAQTAEREREHQESLRLAVLALARRVQTSAHRIQETVSLMADRHPHNPDVLESSMQVDHAAAQQGRHAQSLAVLCGEWPGQQWPRPLALVDVVRAAASRIVAYKRIEVSGDPDTAAAAQVVEPLIHLVAELLANATQCSPPSTKVLVAVRNVQRGAVIEIDDGGVGMDEHHLEQAREIVSGRRPVDVGEVGEIPQTGLAVIGHYVRRHGFLADLLPSPYGGVRAVVLVPSEIVETLEPITSPLSRAPERARLSPPPAVRQAEADPLAARPAVVDPLRAQPAAVDPLAVGPAEVDPLGGRSAETDPGVVRPAEADPPRSHETGPLAVQPREIEVHETGPIDVIPHEGDLLDGGELPRRRSRRGERAEEPEPAPPAGQPSPEQAGAWMAAFFDQDEEPPGQPEGER
ncbi:ATP-binding protein [Nonomuraea sp. NPDC050536]|uniref:ATP-binding protein n=1 Tax=Nonomuraea sp. NPDC050536 TaxID=3364366 RepID=UPI0037C8DE31